ncbi:hypothetical protein QN277_025137 [Acacia crassicarpa]|uniref:CCHC-type domain-containing protein n=1 Tax=Acacia crassicarpa TaxID=499986 RepID=A0AAE1JI87_9FABA|nr:hypothetical protein QN277_025137 [Acacia crassicarpa]
MEVGGSGSSKLGKEVVLSLDRSADNRGRTLVGKIMTNKNLNVPTVISMIKKGWQMDEEVEVHELEKSQLIFLFRFHDLKGYARILKGRPWSILGFLLNLQKWEDCMVLEEVKFDVSPFWVQFHGVPLEAFNNSNAKLMGDAVGESVLFEKPKLGDRLNRAFIKVRSLVRMDEPLTTGFWVPRGEKERVWVSVKYERLQHFCYLCGRVGHDGRSCKVLPEDRLEKEKRYDYGSWLSTSTVRTTKEALVVCKPRWDEAEFIVQNSQPPESRRSCLPVRLETVKENRVPVSAENQSLCVKGKEVACHTKGMMEQEHSVANLVVPTQTSLVCQNEINEVDLGSSRVVPYSITEGVNAEVEDISRLSGISSVMWSGDLGIVKGPSKVDLSVLVGQDNSFGPDPANCSNPSACNKGLHYNSNPSYGTEPSSLESYVAHDLSPVSAMAMSFNNLHLKRPADLELDPPNY